MLIHGVCVEAVHLCDVLFQHAYNLGQLAQLLAGHSVNDIFSAVFLHNGLDGVNERLQTLHEQAVQVHVLIQCLLERIELLHKLCVSLGCVPSSQLLLAGEVNTGEEGDHRVFQRVGDVLYFVLVVGVQHPAGQLVHVAPNSIPVFLYGSRVIPAVPPSLQHLLAFLALLLLNHFSGLLQHALEHRLVLHGEHRFAGPLDLLVQNLHAVVRCLGGLPVNLGSELLLLVKTALFCSLFLELLQPAQTLVEYLQCVSLTVGQLIHAQLAGRVLEHFPVRQGVGALLVLLGFIGENVGEFFAGNLDLIILV